MSEYEQKVESGKTVKFNAEDVQKYNQQADLNRRLNEEVMGFEYINKDGNIVPNHIFVSSLENLNQMICTVNCFNARKLQSIDCFNRIQS
jgi:hypothetical protein